MLNDHQAFAASETPVTSEISSNSTTVSDQTSTKEQRQCRKYRKQRQCQVQKARIVPQVQKTRIVPSTESKDSAASTETRIVPQVQKG